MIIEGFNSVEDIKIQFDIQDDVPFHEYEILFAVYETPMYEGYAKVLYRHNGKFYEVNGSHCSCYGLEGQWEPQEMPLEQLRMENLRGYYGDVVHNLWSALVWSL